MSSANNSLSTSYLSSSANGGVVTGLDISQDMLKKARKSISAVDFIQADISNTKAIKNMMGFWPGIPFSIFLLKYRKARLKNNCSAE